MTRRVVTLPAGLDAAAALSFVRAARAQGADLLELRTDLHGSELSAAALAEVIPLLVAERAGQAVPNAWRASADLFDAPLGSGAIAKAHLISHHADRPMEPAAVLALWSRVARSSTAGIKHVEPLGPLPSAGRLFDTQRLLIREFGLGRVTVLAAGPCAQPFRAVLARRNALDYLALTPESASAPGQRLLADAVCSAGSDSDLRLGILGSGITHSRSPRIHPPPFDRIDLPAEAPIGELVDALLPHYRGLAVTAPFKRAVAEYLGSTEGAVNTLVRHAGRWRTANTDVEGASAALNRLGSRRVVVLGGGGASVALLAAAKTLGIECVVRRRREPDGAAVGDAAVWTWPSSLPTPADLRFDGARVGVIAYGPPGRRVAQQIAECGGVPVRLGARWLIAQARRQRALWSDAT